VQLLQSPSEPLIFQAGKRLFLKIKP